MAESFGFGNVLYAAKDARVDIIFVHGLRGDRVKTWTSLPTDEVPLERFWPKDFLPIACPTARILSFGYDAEFVDFYCPSEPKDVPQGTTIDDHSADLFLSLGNLRSSTQTPPDRPIIFVCHSLGGLVVANALSRQHGSNDSNLSLVANTCGVIFLGTPFEGSEMARWGGVALRLLKSFGITHNWKLKDLEKRSTTLAKINEDFYKFLYRSDCPVEVACFFEEYPTYVKKTNTSIGLVVEKSSASLKGVDPIPVAASHSAMCKFQDEHRKGYKDVSGILSHWIKKIDEQGRITKTRASIYQEKTVYQGNITDNRGVVMGNVYGATPKANIITGSTNTFYYGSQPPSDRDGGIWD